jgi:hypothetical protein
MTYAFASRPTLCHLGRSGSPGVRSQLPRTPSPASSTRVIVTAAKLPSPMMTGTAKLRSGGPMPAADATRRADLGRRPPGRRPARGPAGAAARAGVAVGPRLRRHQNQAVPPDPGPPRLTKTALRAHRSIVTSPGSGEGELNLYGIAAEVSSTPHAPTPSALGCGWNYGLTIQLASRTGGPGYSTRLGCMVLIGPSRSVPLGIPSGTLVSQPDVNRL